MSTPLVRGRCASCCALSSLADADESPRQSVRCAAVSHCQCSSASRASRQPSLFLGIESWRKEARAVGAVATRLHLLQQQHHRHRPRWTAVAAAAGKMAAEMEVAATLPRLLRCSRHLRRWRPHRRRHRHHRRRHPCRRRRHRHHLHWTAFLSRQCCLGVQPTTSTSWQATPPKGFPCTTPPTAPQVSVPNSEDAALRHVHDQSHEQPG